MEQKIIITGPESTGKTTLARALSEAKGVPFVPEYAREYLRRRQGVYREADLLQIAKKQDELERHWAGKIGDPIICDTSMLVLKIWSRVKYGRVHPWIEQAFEERTNHLHILCAPDFPWEPDPLREHPEGREELFEWYLEVLEDREVPFRIARGTPEQRLEKALDWIENFGANAYLGPASP